MSSRATIFIPRSTPLIFAALLLALGAANFANSITADAQGVGACTGAVLPNIASAITFQTTAARSPQGRPGSILLWLGRQAFWRSMRGPLQ